MPWELISLNDGHQIPSIAFGTWKLGNGQGTTDTVETALGVGFDHIDTAQSYRNEVEAGQGFKESGLSRSDVFITTKYSGLDGLDIPTSIQNSLKNLGVSYVDLYLIHHPRLAQPDIPTAWAEMEKLKEQGLVKSIGVSNFGVAELSILLASAKVKPAANQILFHPYVYKQQTPIVEFAAKHKIAIEAYSLLIPVTQQPGGPLDKPLQKIGARLNVTPDQVLMAWAKAKGVVVVTSSTKDWRMKGYLESGDLELTEDEINSIDTAGASGQRRLTAKIFIKRAAALALAGAGVLGLCSYFGIDVL